MSTTYKNNVFAFGGVGGSISKILKRFKDKHWEKMSNYCEKASYVANLDLGKYLQDPTILTDMDKVFADWCLTYIVDCIIYEEYVEKGVTPHIFIGYSLGLNTALVCAGSITFQDGVRLLMGVKECAKAYFESKELGMGIVVGLPVNEILRIIDQVGYQETVKVAAENSQECCVISGNYKSLLNVLKLAEEEGALKAKDLHIPYAFHFGKQHEIEEKYLLYVNEMQINDSNVPVMSVYNQKILKNNQELREELNTNVHKSMKWKQTIEQLQNSDYKYFYDVSIDATLKKISMLEGEAEFYMYKTTLNYRDTERW